MNISSREDEITPYPVKIGRKKKSNRIPTFVFITLFNKMNKTQAGVDKEKIGRQHQTGHYTLQKINQLEVTIHL